MIVLSDFAASVSDLAESVRLANNDPRDAIRQLSKLAAFGLVADTGDDPVGIAGFRFAGPGKLWAGTSRPSPGSYTDARGAVLDLPAKCVRPTFALGGGITGWLDEPTRTNLQVSSGGMGLGPGFYAIGTNTNDGGLVTAPDLTATARRCISNHASGANVFFARNIALSGIAANTAYTLSVYLRLNAGTGSTGRAITIDENNGTTNTRSNGALLSTLSPVPGGAWVRATRTLTTRPDTTSMQVYWLDGPATGEQWDVWGCQIEQAATASSFIRTPNGAGATRQADSVYLRRDAPLSKIGAAEDAARDATAALCRRAALASLARALAEYAPASGQDARDALARVLPLYDAEALRAADTGDDGAYAALRALRCAVADDLHARGLRLPEVVRVVRPQSQPALVAAHSLYGDAEREDELVRRVEPVHPLFLPPEFDALTA